MWREEVIARAVLHWRFANHAEHDGESQNLKRPFALHFWIFSSGISPQPPTP